MKKTDDRYKQHIIDHQHNHHRNHHHEKIRRHHRHNRQKLYRQPNIIPEVSQPANASQETTVQQMAKCFAHLATMELCQRCASVTKTLDVLPLCCSDTDGVQNWCVDYLAYGVEKSQ